MPREESWSPGSQSGKRGWWKSRETQNVGPCAFKLLGHLRLTITAPTITAATHPGPLRYSMLELTNLLLKNYFFLRV